MGGNGQNLKKSVLVTSAARPGESVVDGQCCVPAWRSISRLISASEIGLFPYTNQA
jgi:hypothetical protein